jgi:uncharacterized OsmC-like protein
MAENKTVYEITAYSEAGSGTATAHSKSSDIIFDAGSLPDPDLPGPADLLAIAFGACVLKNVSRFSELLRFSYGDATIHVTAEREEGSPPRIARIHYRLNITTDEPERRVDLLRRNIERYGTIYNTLAASTEVSGEIVATALVAG